MPAYKDSKTNKWYVKFYYTDWEGKKKQKLKRGFTTKREAEDYEHKFIASYKYDDQTTMEEITKDFMEERAPRYRLPTISGYENTIKNHINPYFGRMPLAAITEKQYVSWQNKLLASGYAPTYIHKIDTNFRTIFKFGARRCKLQEIPFYGLEKVGQEKADKMNFWTLEDFNTFISFIKKPMQHLAFNLLFFCGLRMGELLALQSSDIDTEKGILYVTKSVQKKGGKEYITAPKTKKGIREITLSKSLCDEVEAYKAKIYGCTDDTVLFTMEKTTLRYPLKKYAEVAGLPEIRMHDLRHSHVSLLIEKNIPVQVISERIGHENPTTTLNIYGHLYPNKQQVVTDLLNSL